VTTEQRQAISNNVVILQDVLNYFVKVVTEQDVIEKLDPKILNSKLIRAENGLRALAAMTRSGVASGE